MNVKQIKLPSGETLTFAEWHDDVLVLDQLSLTTVLKQTWTATEGQEFVINNVSAAIDGHNALSGLSNTETQVAQGVRVQLECVGNAYMETTLWDLLQVTRYVATKLTEDGEVEEQEESRGRVFQIPLLARGGESVVVRLVVSDEARRIIGSVPEWMMPTATHVTVLVGGFRRREIKAGRYV